MDSKATNTVVQRGTLFLFSNLLATTSQFYNALINQISTFGLKCTQLIVFNLRE